MYGCNGRGVKEFSHPLKQLRGHTNVVYRAGCTEPHDEDRGFSGLTGVSRSWSSLHVRGDHARGMFTSAVARGAPRRPRADRRNTADRIHAGDSADP